MCPSVNVVLSKRLTINSTHGPTGNLNSLSQFRFTLSGTLIMMSYKLWGSCLAIHQMNSIYFPREALMDARATKTLVILLVFRGGW